MILHEYNIKFIVPSTQVEPNMETFFGNLQDLFSAKGMTLHGIKFGRDTDYTKEMTVLVTFKPTPPPEPPKSPEEQIKNLEKAVK